jgi:molybdenum cofactor cytidylyltransferase
VSRAASGGGATDASPARAALADAAAAAYARAVADIDCVLLAAGASSRMGRYKPLLPWRGTTVVETSAAAALAVASRVLLVVGYRGDELAALFAGRARVEIVPNPDYAAGLFSSVQAGVRRVRTSRFFVALADMPLVTPGLYERLLAEPPAPAVRPLYDGTRGHPVLLDASMIAPILAEPVTGMMRNVIARVAARDMAVDDPAALLDLDEPADYERLAGHSTDGDDRPK